MIMIYFFIMCFLTVYHAYQIEIASRVTLNVVGGVHSPLSSPKGTEVMCTITNVSICFPHVATHVFVMQNTFDKIPAVLTCGVGPHCQKYVFIKISIGDYLYGPWAI